MRGDKNMSRTATGKWKRLRREVLAEAQANGLTHCPMCKTWLDYEHSLQWNSPEVDHIIPAAQGGPDTKDNTQVLCQTCNRRKGDGRKKRQPAKRIETDTRIDW